MFFKYSHKHISRLVQQSLVRRISVLAGGTVSAQVITLLATPLITRLYTPEDYGILGIFTSTLAIISVVAALSYPMAIALPREKQEAGLLFSISICLSLVVSTSLGLLLYFKGSNILAYFSIEELSSLQYLLPPAVFFATLNTSVTNWLARDGAFSHIAKLSIATATMTVSSRLLFGFLNPSAIALASSAIGAAAISSVLAMLTWAPHQKRPSAFILTRVSAQAVAAKYRDFAFLRTPQVFINTASHGLPVVLIAVYAGAQEAGLFALASSILAAPTRLLAGSVYTVFYPSISADIAEGKACLRQIQTTTKGIAVAGALPTIVVLFLGPELFITAFGANWEGAGVYGQLLGVWVFLQVVNKPAVAAVPALKGQKELLAYEVLSTLSKIFALWIGFEVFNSSYVAVAFFSASGCLAYIFLIAWVFKRAANHDHLIGDRMNE